MRESAGKHLKQFESQVVVCYYDQRDTYIISFAAELPEGLNVEPGALVTGRVQRNTHGVFFQQSRETLVDRQVLVALDVQELRQKGLHDSNKNFIRRKTTRLCTT